MAATTTYNNVINLQPGGPRVTVAANRILLECRDLAARRLREALREMLQRTSEDLARRADNTTDGEERRFLYGLKDRFTENGGRLEGQLAAHWGREFDSALKGSPNHAPGELLLEELQIVDFGEMDEDLALKALANRLKDKCESELYALGRRFNFLVGRENSAEDANPSSPEVFTRSLKDALRDTEFDSRARLELFRFLESGIDADVGPVYHALNAHLLQHGILPNLRRDYGRAASQPSKTGSASSIESKANTAPADMFDMLQRLVSGGVPAAAPQGPAGALAALAGTGERPAAPAHVWASLETLQHTFPVAITPQPTASDLANVLHQFRASDVGQGLGQLDAITVDIVAMLFDMIFDDREIADPIKALVGKLQIPVLKVAMLDRSFFSSKAHPTRRLLEVISRAALRWGREISHDDPLYRKIAEVIERIHSDFKQDTSLFEALAHDLEAFLKTHEAAAEGNVTRAAKLVVQRELEELATMAADCELQLWLGSDLPTAVSELLDHEWRALLKRIHLKEGPDSEVWQTALSTAGDLVDSVRAKHDVKERQALARQLPILIKQLTAGFDRVGVPADRRHRLLDALFSLHAASLRGNEPPATAYETPAPEPVADEPDIASQALDDGEVKVQSISVTAPLLAAQPLQDVAALQRGDWVEYLQADGSAIRYRLSWISPQRGIFLFTNPESPNALAVSPEAMSLQIERGEARILSTEPIFDRALSRTIDVLQAA
ncbi:MAG: hypothetical protein CVU18_01850 [Betaproteobacteria bacterium HGW-Betaproteobacteria-12]|nr:MAG: hypothetical protein CVU18_01850 [Betaproteobacteria bacterium HGW-Betaproteobacteria-12]